MAFEKIPGKSKKVPDKPENASDRLGAVPVRKVAPRSGVPVRRPPVSSGVRARVPVSNAQSGRVPVRRAPPVSQGGVPGRVPVRSPAQQQSPYARRIPVRRVAPGSGFVRPGSRRTQSTVGRVPPGSTLGGVPVNKSSGSRFSVFRDKFEDVFDGVKDKLENVFDDVSDRFDNFQYVPDFLRGHWWAILVVLGVIGVLTFSGFVGISSLKEDCTFSLSVECLDHSVKKDSVELLIKNVAERNIIVKNIKVRSDVLEGLSGSDSGTCELALDQRGRILKKDAKFSFNLDIRPVSELSAEGYANAGNGWNLLADNVILAKAQPSGHTPQFVATAESVQCTVRNEARSYISSVSDRRLRNVLSHYTDLVVGNATDPHPEQDPNRASLRAKERARVAAESIKAAVIAANQDIYSQALNQIPVVSGDNSEVLQAINDAVNDFAPGSSRNDPIKYQSALYVKRFAYGSDATELVQSADGTADRFITMATNHLNGITEAARSEANRRIDVAGVKSEVRDYAEYYAGEDSYIAADFVADAVEQASDAAEIRENARTAHNTVNKGLTAYFWSIRSLYQITFPPRYARNFTDRTFYEVSFVDLLGSIRSRNVEGPVRTDYHALIIGRFNDFVAGLESDVYATGFYNRLNSQEKTHINSAFSDSRYTGSLTPLNDPELRSRHPEANKLLNNGIVRHYADPIQDITSDKLIAGDVHRKAVELTRMPNVTTVTQAAKNEANRVGYGNMEPAADFVKARITGSSESAVVSNVESAVREVIPKVTDGARHVADEADRVSRAGPTTPAGDPVADIRNYVSENYPSSNLAHHAAVFVVNSNIGGNNASTVADNVDRVGSEIWKAVTLAVGNVSEVTFYVDSCLDCSAYCFDFYCENFYPTNSYNVKLIPWCSQYDRYCEKYPDNCDCSRSGVSCSSDADCCADLVCSSGTCQIEAVCGSVGEVCCAGNLCNGNLECRSGRCEVAVVCGSVGEVCCAGNSCDSGFECVSGTCQIEAVCGSVGEVCCAGNLCNGNLECRSGRCEVAVVCGSEGEVCCSGGAECTGDLVCMGLGSGATCQPCGSGGQVCCTGRECVEGFQCTGLGTGMCVGDCGSQGQECCTGDNECGTDLVCVASGEGRTCQSCGKKDIVCCTTGDQCRESGLECSEGTCVEVEECGSEGQVCCAASTCASGLECKSGTCRTLPCGSEGEICCRDGKCNSDLECSNNLCEAPEGAVQPVQHFSLGTLASGSNTSLVVNETDIPFSSVEFTVSAEVIDAELNVTSWSEPPPGVSGGPVGVQSYSYVTIASGDLRNEDVSPVVVEFSVAKDFFSEGVSPDYVRLFEYNKVSHAWNKLDDPAYLSEDEDSHYFKVVADGLVGDFAIGLEKFVSCAHRDLAEGKNRYTIELIYSWESSPAVNHKVAGELLANSPE